MQSHGQGYLGQPSYTNDDRPDLMRSVSNGDGYHQPYQHNAYNPHHSGFGTFQLPSYNMQPGPTPPGTYSQSTIPEFSAPPHNHPFPQSHQEPPPKKRKPKAADAPMDHAPARPYATLASSVAGSSQAPTQTPPISDANKKPRGRPRKVPPPVSPPLMPPGVIAFSSTQVLMAPEYGSTPSETPGKRPRGRPRKDATSPAASTAQPTYSLPGTAYNASPLGQADAKKPRGRPRKDAQPVPLPLPALPPQEAWGQTPINTLKEYVNKLNAHITSTEARGGNAGSYQTTGEWTAADKAAFYPLLARHSALRPDLIAHDMGKSELQVRQYIGGLQVMLPGTEGLHRGGRIGKGEWARGIAPAAREIGDGDMGEEDAVAAVLLLDAEEAAESSSRKTKGKGRMMDVSMWGSSLDGTKLSSLSEFVQNSTPKDPLAGNKAAKMLRDEQIFAALSAIPIDQRSASQVTEIRRLKDRKSMRMKYRHGKLIEEGMTAEEIAAQGGPDAIYLARNPININPAPMSQAAPADDPLKGNKHAKIMRDEARLTAILAMANPTPDELAESRRLVNKKRARQRIRKRKLLEDGMTEEELAAIDVDEYYANRAGVKWGEDELDFAQDLGDLVSKQGLDLWNYDLIGRRFGDVKPSFGILDQLQTYLLAFLVPLISKTINLAEREGAEPAGHHVRLLLDLVAAVKEEIGDGEDELWEIQTTTTDDEDEELDDLLNQVDEAYDLEGDDWDDPFGVEASRRVDASEAARVKRKVRYNKKRARRAAKRQKGTVRKGVSSNKISESIIDSSEEGSLGSDEDGNDQFEGHDAEELDDISESDKDSSVDENHESDED